MLMPFDPTEVLQQSRGQLRAVAPKPPHLRAVWHKELRAQGLCAGASWLISYLAIPKNKPIGKGEGQGVGSPSAGWASACSSAGAQLANMKYLIAQELTQAECGWLGCLLLRSSPCLGREISSSRVRMGQ